MNAESSKGYRFTTHLLPYNRGRALAILPIVARAKDKLRKLLDGHSSQKSLGIGRMPASLGATAHVFA
jgi:hypothetical protein